MPCRRCNDEKGRSWWDCPHGSAQPSDRPDPLVRGFAIGGLVAVAAALLLKLAQWLASE